MAAGIFICTLNPSKIAPNQIHIWCQFPVVARWIRQSPPLPISILPKQLKILLLFQKLPENSCKNLYSHHYTFNKSSKSFSYLTPLSCSGQVNSPNPFSGKINLTETVTNLIAAWKSLSKMTAIMSIFTVNPLKLPSNQVHIWWQPLLFPISILQKQLKIYLLFQKSLKNVCNILYFCPYTFDMSYKLFSYLMSLSRRGPVNPLSQCLAISVWLKQ